MKGEHYGHIFPFLWVHGEDEATYRKMIGVIQDADIQSFCVEARPHPGFCTDTWWRDMDIILDEAEKRGMKVWILDDKHFPTGYANGGVETRPEELRRLSLLMHSFPVTDGRVQIDLRECLCAPVSSISQEYDMSCGSAEADSQLSPGRILSITAVCGAQMLRLTEPQAADWIAPSGEWTVYVCAVTANAGVHRNYINMMDRDSCRIQLDEVYEPHYAHYREKFGSVIAGFFSDEPELGNGILYHMDNPLGTPQDLPWSRELERALQQRLGDGYASLLPLLWRNDADAAETARVRFAYMDCVSRLVEQDFSRQIGDWCRQRGVEYIGHVIEDNNQHARTGTSLGHYFRGLKWQSMAGIDDIGDQVCPQGEDRRSRSVFDFVQDGEFYHYSLGKLGTSLAALNPHMHGRTMCEIFGNYGWTEGVRLEKYLLDHFMVRGVNHFVPHAFTCREYPDPDCPPHFYAQGHNPQYRHFGRLMGYARRVCQRISDGAACTPVAVLYHGEAEWSGKCMLMQKVARVCLDNQVDFLFVPADAFAEADFYRTDVGKKLVINSVTFETLVLPYAQFITPETACAIETMMLSGGDVAFVDALPDGLTDGTGLPDALRRVPVVPLEKLAQRLAAYKTTVLSPANDRVRAMHYRAQDELLYLFNEGADTYCGTVTLPFAGDVCCYNAWEDRYEAAHATDGVLHVKLHPSESLLIVPAAGKEVCQPLAMRGGVQLLTKFERSVCRSVDYPAFSDVQSIEKLESYHRTDPAFSGFIRYETDFAYSGGFAGLEIVDAYEGVEVFVNGASMGIQVLPPFRYDLSQACVPGTNRLSIEVATTLGRERCPDTDTAPTGITGAVRLWRERL